MRTWSFIFIGLLAAWLLANASESKGFPKAKAFILVGYGFDVVGNLQALRYGNGVTNGYQYDDVRNRLTNVVWQLNGSVLANFGYTVGVHWEHAVHRPPRHICFNAFGRKSGLKIFIKIAKCCSFGLLLSTSQAYTTAAAIPIFAAIWPRVRFLVSRLD